MLDMQPIIDAIADRVAERLLRAQERMVSQANSELGARRHRAAVKRRLESGEGGAAIVGRKHLLTPEALREELARPDTGGGSKAAGARPGAGPRKDPAPGGATVQPPRDRTLKDFERDLMRGLQEIE